jgi:hypothetical protein
MAAGFSTVCLIRAAALLLSKQRGRIPASFMGGTGFAERRFSSMFQKARQ